MQARFNHVRLASPAFQSLLGVEKYLAESSVDHKLLHLLKLRASQINGCAYCIDLHWKDARAAGETEQRLYGLPAWRESPYYTDAERAALAWTEAITDVTDGHVPDELHRDLQAHFTEQQIVDLTWAAAAINAWNRLAIAGRAVPGNYRPAHVAAAAAH